MAILGFDFGTTNSLISVIVGGKVINFLQDDQPIPSVVCYEGSKTIVGREARERQSEAGLGVKGNIVRSPKTILGEESVFVEGVARSPVDIVSDVITHVASVARADSRARELGNLSDVVVTIPVNMLGYRRAALRDAFRRAGLRIRQFVHEPLAALYAFLRTEGDVANLARLYDRQLLLVVDWGGGTLDITLCRMLNGTLYQVVNDGTETVGGDIFDTSLRAAVVARILKERRLATPPDASPEARTRLLHRIEQAKVRLSEREEVPVYVPSYFCGLDDNDLSCTLTRNELEATIGVLISEGLERVTRLLDRAGVVPAQVALCLAVGGMSNMPAIRSRLHEWFGAERVHVSTRTASLIAEGAAWMAHDRQQLRLAKNLELSLARNSRLTLLRAGMAMPSEGEVQAEKYHLFCTDPRDGFAKMHIEAPVKVGSNVLPNDMRKNLADLSLKVDAAARPFFERLEMDVSVDENLVLTATCHSSNVNDHCEAKVHDLEFALQLPVERPEHGTSAGEGEPSGGMGAERLPGAVTIRGNVIDRVDPYFVPGELLYSYDSQYFNKVNGDPPEIQDLERLYYTPCSFCGRRSNDPACHCASRLEH